MNNIFLCKILTEHCGRFYDPYTEYTCIGRIGTVGENLLIIDTTGRISDVPYTSVKKVGDYEFLPIETIRVSLKRKDTKLYKLGESEVFTDTVYEAPDYFTMIGVVGSKIIANDDSCGLAFSIYPSKLLFHSFVYKDL